MTDGSVHKDISPLQGYWLIVIFLAAIIIAAGCVFVLHVSDTASWVVLMLLIVLFIGLLGRDTIGRWPGIFVNERNLMSLSRMQITAWTVLIVSALIVMVLARLAAGVADPFGIDIDWHIWAVLGLSASAAVGAPMINSAKSAREPAVDKDQKEADPAKHSEAVQRAATELGEKEEDIEKNRDGILYVNTSPGDARFTDIFEGDELANTMYIDVTKVQMFWLSGIAIAGYAILLLNMFLSTAPGQLAAFPAFSDGIVAILAVSHATYLTGKGFTQTKSTG